MMRFIIFTVIVSLTLQEACSFTPNSRTAVTRNHHRNHPIISSKTSTSSSSSLVVLQERKFAQKQNANKPKFQQKQNQNRRNNSDDDDKTSQPKYRGDSKLVELHDQRVKTAGRVGTKRFVDPCKVFVGNLPYTTTSKQLKEFVLTTMGQTQLVVHSTKIIKDWKTGKSKGYGFIMFTDPIYATVCMEVVHNSVLDGRHVTVSQGKKKDQDNILFIKKKNKQEADEEALSDEDRAIASGLEEAESDEEDDDEIDEDLDLDEDGIPIFRDIDASDAEDLELDAKLFGIVGGDDDDDDDDYSDIDGIFLERGPIYEDMDPNMNREQRRDAARRMKRKKMPHKGFG